VVADPASTGEILIISREYYQGNLLTVACSADTDVPHNTFHSPLPLPPLRAGRQCHGADACARGSSPGNPSRRPLSARARLPAGNLRAVVGFAVGQSASAKRASADRSRIRPFSVHAELAAHRNARQRFSACSGVRGAPASKSFQRWRVQSTLKQAKRELVFWNARHTFLFLTARNNSS